MSILCLFLFIPLTIIIVDISPLIGFFFFILFYFKSLMYFFLSFLSFFLFLLFHQIYICKILIFFFVFLPSMNTLNLTIFLPSFFLHYFLSYDKLKEYSLHGIENIKQEKKMKKKNEKDRVDQIFKGRKEKPFEKSILFCFFFKKKNHYYDYYYY